MLAILVVQVLLMAAFALWATFRFMGRDDDDAVMAGGHCGCEMGAPPSAVANMKALVKGSGGVHVRFHRPRQRQRSDS